LCKTPFKKTGAGARTHTHTHTRPWSSLKATFSPLYEGKSAKFLKMEGILLANFLDGILQKAANCLENACLYMNKWTNGKR